MTRNHASQPALSGEEVGRLVLKDLAAIYQNSRQGRKAEGLISPAEKADLVNRLTAPQDVAAYNQYRYVHEYLSRAAVLFLLEEANAEVCFWRLCALLEPLKLAEQENAHFLLEQPRLMTRRQYENSRQLFDDPLAARYGCGAALVEVQSLPAKSGLIDKKGCYQPPVPQWRRPFLAEMILSVSRDDLSRDLQDYQASLRECLVIKTAAELLAKFVGVPEAAEVIGDLKYGFAQVEILNDLMRQIPPLIQRRGVFPEERPEDELRAELAALLAPINPKQLKPTPAAVRRARKMVDFTTAQGQSEQLYAVLREREN